jgi:putative sterol carrier protein
MTTKEEIVNTLKGWVQKISDEKYAWLLSGWNKLMQDHFTDTDEFYYIKFTDGKPEGPIEGAVDYPEIPYKISGDTFLAISRKEISGVKAFMTGKVKVKASMQDKLKLQKLDQ